MFLAFAELLMLTTPCFDTVIEIDLAYVLEVRVSRDGAEGIVLARSGYPHIVKAAICGVGDWVIESRTGSECIEMVGYRSVTGNPCVWSQWLETVTATVSDQTTPDGPRFVLKRDLVRTPDTG